MKKVISVATLLFASLICFAQMDIATLDGKTPNQIISIIGAPNVVDTVGHTCSVTLIYGDCVVFLDEMSEDDGEYRLCGFETDSPSYCILSDLVPGGIRVGDRMSKLQSLDFVNTKYGKGNTQNAFKSGRIETKLLTDAGKAYVVNYSLFGAERVVYLFCIEGETVRALSMISKEEWETNEVF